METESEKIDTKQLIEVIKHS